MRLSLKIYATLIIAGLYLVITPPLARGRQANILILNSYHKGFVWTDSIVNSIDNSLKESGISYRSFTEYMDTKRFFGKLHLQNLHALYQEKYRHITLDVIISTDDNAFTFLEQHHGELFPETPVVFCGVNDINARTAQGNIWFTGVLEMIDIRATLETARILHPGITRVAVVVDKTPTGENTKKMLEKVLPLFTDLEFSYFNDTTMSDLLTRVTVLPDTAIVLLLNFNRDAGGNVFSHMETVKALRQSCEVPIYAVWDFFLGKGIVGGMLASGTLQGKQAARIALSIVNGQSPDALPVITDSPNQFMFDFNELQRFSIKPSALPLGAVVINTPRSFYSVNKKIIWMLVSAIIFLGTLTLVLTLNILKRRAAEKSSIRLNRALMTLSHCNQSVIRAGTEAELLLEICREIVETGGYLLCWVGFADDAGKKLIPQAIWRAGTGKASSQTIDWCNNTLGTGINGQTYQNGKPTVVQDIPNDRLYRPWRKEAMERGFASTIALPLGPEKKPFGVLRIYSPELNGFDSDEVGLLTWLSDNLTFGILAQRIAVEHRQTLHQLRHSTEQLSMLLESLPIVPYTGEGKVSFRFTYIGNTIQDITGYSALTIKESSHFLEQQIHPDDKKRVLKWFRKTATHGIRKINYRFKTADGTYRWLCDTRRNITDFTGGVLRLVGTWQDITEEIQLRNEVDYRLQQVIQADKLASLGEVVAGVAHEINNPNSFISYNIPLLAETWEIFRPIIESWGKTNPNWQNDGMELVDYCDDMDGIIHDVQAGSKRINKVVKNLKEFVRSDQGIEAESLDLSNAVHKAIAIIGPQIKRTIKHFQLELADQLPPIHGWLIKIEQVITNLAVNAIHAMGEKKDARLCIRTRHIDYHGCIVLQVEDNGIGINGDVINKIFDPFFTRRRDAGGTGLGLAVCSRLIQEHRGSITVISRPGIGTIFHVFFPIEPNGLTPMKPTVLYCGSLGNFNDLTLALKKASYRLKRFNDNNAQMEETLVENPQIQAIIVESDWLWEQTKIKQLTDIHQRFPLMLFIVINRSEHGTEDLLQKLSFDVVLNVEFLAEDLITALTAIVHRSL